MTQYDGIVIGGGHNGLTCAAYLAKAGLKMAVVERNDKMGGGCMTDEITLPGFKHNLHSNYHTFAEGPVDDDLELEKYGLKYVYPEAQAGLAFSDGTSIIIHRDKQKTAASFARFSKQDAERYLELEEKFGNRARPLVNQFLYSHPLSLEEMGHRLKGSLGEEILSYNSLTLYGAIDRNFESEQVRALFKGFFVALQLIDKPNMGSFFPRVFSRMTRLGLAVGGAQALTDALGRVVEAYGGVLIRGRQVDEIKIKAGRVSGVRLDNGDELEATRFVASSIDIPQTLRLSGEGAFDPEITEKVKKLIWQYHSLLTLHVALNEPPNYAAAKFDPDINRTFNVFIGADTSSQIVAYFEAIERGEIPTRLFGNGACTSLFDPSVAPPGKYAAFWVPPAPYDVKGEGPQFWDRHKEEMTERILEEWRVYAPNMTMQNVLGTSLFSPLDIERTCINMVRGSHHGLAYIPSQLGGSRPLPEMGQYRTQVKGLYLCGSSSHSGGGVTGSPGYNCANTITEDQDIPRWWVPLPSPQLEE